ncbi:MAG: hypothetical protein N4A32_00295 [Marinifilaceae bacterium]|jgi:transcription elongation factor|nr:hypothetical protein [Marinifilaceae bacterium]
MKKYISILLVFTAVLLSSCKVGVMSESYGLEDNGFIQVVSDTKKEFVVLVIDDTKRFEVKVDKLRKMKVRGKKYTISTGKHNIKVYNQAGKLLYNKMVFISTQQSHVIKL